jgi:ribonuclease-3
LAGTTDPLHDDVLDRCEELLEYTFSDRSLLELALTHSSVATHYLKSNERLEFLGDAVLGLAVCEELYRRFPEANEGDMTRIKSVVVSRQACAQVAASMGLDQLLFLSKGVEGGDGLLPQSLIACALESLIGAVYLDGGFDVAGPMVLRMMEPELQRVAEGEHELNYKSMLQQFGQRRFGSAPSYEVLDEKGPDHSKAFEIAVLLNGRRYPSAWGLSKKEAEQKAAKAALIALGHVEPDEE